jgi:hypothetical protein
MRQALDKDMRGSGFERPSIPSVAIPQPRMVRSVKKALVESFIHRSCHRVTHARYDLRIGTEDNRYGGVAAHSQRLFC